MRRRPGGRPQSPFLPPAGGPLAVAATFALGALLLVACGSSPAPSASGTHGHARNSSTSTSPSGAATTTTTSATPGSTLAPVSTAGPLQAGAPIALPFSADRVTAAESPDGAVIAAPQDPTSAAPGIAWVVDGSGPAAVAEHVPTGIAALTADGANFYAATYSAVYSYDRASGNQNNQWSLPPVSTAGTANASNDDLVALAAAAGSVFVSVTQGNTVSVYRITPSSAAAPHLLLRGLGAAIGPDGSVYYETTDHRLAVRRPGGTTVTGPALAATPNGLGGGVQYVNAVAGGAVWVSEPAGQGLDAHYTTYASSTLAVVGSYSGTVTSSIMDTAAGPLVLESAGSGATCPEPAAGAAPSGCVLRIDPQGALSDQLSVGAAVTLLGPGPAVVVSDTSTGQFDLVRLS